MITKPYNRNRNMYVWFIEGIGEGCLSNATHHTVNLFRRQGDTFRQATLRDWHKAKKGIIIYK